MEKNEQNKKKTHYLNLDQTDIRIEFCFKIFVKKMHVMIIFF